MGDLAKPKAMPTKRNKADDAFANVLKNYVQGAGAPGQGGFGDWISSNFQLPGYEGEMVAPMTGIQKSAQGYGAGALDAFFGSGGAGQDINTALTSILQDPGPTVDPAKIYSTLDAPRRASMARDLGQMEEQFGVQGLSGSTSLYESGARAQTESQQGLMAQVTQILPQLESVKAQQQGNRLAAAQGLATIPAGVAQAGFNLGEGERAIADTGDQRKYQDFVRQLQMFPELLSYLSGTPQPVYGQSDLESLIQAGSVAAMAFA